MEESNNAKKAAQRLGIYVFIGLMLLTLAEFYVSVEWNSVALLFIIMLLKAAAIVYFFMHVYRLWREESH